MERKVFTYKDAEEARKYIGKRGRFSDSLEACTKGPDGFNDNLYGGILERVHPNGPRFNGGNTVGRFQFFCPDPEPVEKWVPFTANDWPLFMGKPITRLGTVWFLTIQGFNAGEVDIRSSGTYTFKELFEVWTFLDGSPCGKKITEQ